MDTIQLLGQTITPRTISDKICFHLLSAHMNGFDAATLKPFQPHQNQQIHMLRLDKKIESAGNERWKLTELGLAALKSKYPKMFK